MARDCLQVFDLMSNSIPFVSIGPVDNVGPLGGGMNVQQK